MDSKSRLLYWLLDASRGGPTRVRVLRALNEKPDNLRQLALALELDYKTVQGHVELLVENGIIYQLKRGYGSPYFLSPEWEENTYLKQVLNGDENGKKGKKQE